MSRRRSWRAERAAYLRARQPWRTQKPPTEQTSIPDQFRELFDLATTGRGPDGEEGGRIFHRLNLPAQEETTTQLAGMFPFLAGQGLGANGAYIGQDRINRSAFCYDPFALYAAGKLPNPNIGVYGVIGSGKSSLLKTLALRLLAFGIKPICPADTKGEMRPLAEATGMVYVPLGPGMHRALNPVYAPPRPVWMDERTYVQRIEQHRMLLLRSLGETASGRPLTAVEDLLLEQALHTLTRQVDGTSADRLAQPTLPQLVEIMLNPTPEMAAAVPIPLEVLTDGGRNLALRFRSMVHGSLRGVFDGEVVDLDFNKPGVVIDISRIRASEAATALTMTCGQALVDLTLAFSQDRWLKILDECWRQIRYAPIVRRISEGQKLARGDDQTTGSATLIALHRITDLMGASPEVRDLAMGLLADTSTRIIYNQATDQLPATQAALSLTDVETELLPDLRQGTALWKVNTHSALVDHVVLRDGLEWPLIQTDSRMHNPEAPASEGEERYPTGGDPARDMADELGESTKVVDPDPTDPHPTGPGTPDTGTSDPGSGDPGEEAA